LKTKNDFIALKLFISATILLACLTGGPVIASDNKDVILVLDTSLSMVGYGGAYKSYNILDRVKQSIANYIDGLEDGDRVTFMTFDTEIRAYPTIYVDDENDRDILKKYISMTEANGKWTNTYYMVRAAFKKADELEKEDEGHQIVIVVMTDGLDDPAPESRAKRLLIKDIAKRYSDKTWWVYLVNLNELKENKSIARLKKDISGAVKQTTIIEAGKDIKTGIEKNLSQDVDKKIEESGSIAFPLLVALLIIAALLALIYFFLRFSRLKVHGTLEYWNNAVLDPYIMKYDLARRNTRQVVIGPSYNCILKIRDLEIKSPFTITAVKVGKEVKLEIKSGGNYAIDIVNKEHGGYIENGDIFKVVNYTFRYTA
jgi:hypothetical protein